MNLEALAVQLIKRNPVHNDGDSLGRIKYFTARVRGRSEKQCAKSRRQNTYLEALGTLSTIQIIEGIYLPTSIEVEYNGQTLKIPKAVEKQTDSNICVALLVDAIDDVYDKAILISGDSDSVPAVDEIRSRCPSK